VTDLTGPAGTLTLAAAGEDVADARATLRTTLDAAAMGALTASVAHAGNNRLTVILSCLDLLHTGNVDADDLRLALDLATGAAQQLATDFGRLLANTRRPTMQPEAVDLRLALAGAQRLDALLHETAMSVDAQVPAELWVDLDRDALVAALLRVLLLARRGGASAVRASGDDLDIPARTAALRKGRYCRLSFELVEARLPRALRTVVEPGHVVERLDEPLGLQLAALEAYVSASRGQVLLSESTDADSTRVELYLPASSRES
jgi:hypothetical protein